MDDLGSAASFQFANVNEFGSVDYADMNKGVTPIFFVEPIPDEAETEKVGAIRMREQEMVRIHVAGDMLNVASSPVNEDIKRRFAPQYEAWKSKRVDRHIDGTPLKNWPLLPAIRVFEFEQMNIFSVENLRDVSDGNIHKLADGRQWREKAKAWLASAKDNAVAAKYAAENERLRDEVDGLTQKVNELVAESAKRGKQKDVA